MKFRAARFVDRIPVAALCIVLALGADAQVRKILRIELAGGLCTSDVAQVWVASNYQDKPVLATHTTGCFWERDVSNLNPDIALFSLRLKGGRTGCRRAKRVDARTSLVKFSSGAFRDPRDLDIYGVPTLYVREVVKIESDDVPCPEEGSVPTLLQGVQFPFENVRLQIFDNTKARCGLVIDDLSGLQKSKKGDRLIISKNAMDWGLQRKAFEAEQCYAPTVLPDGLLSQTPNLKTFEIVVK